MIPELDKLIIISRRKNPTSNPLKTRNKIGSEDTLLGEGGNCPSGGNVITKSTVCIVMCRKRRRMNPSCPLGADLLVHIIWSLKLIFGFDP